MTLPRIAALSTRARIVRAVRAELDRRGFVEVQTPVLMPGACPDRAIAPFAVPGAGYLVSSTEYELKRLFADGLVAGYTLGPNFRRGDLGPRHNPEFTMVEWGRAGATMAEVEDEAEALVRAAGGACDVDLPPAWPRIGVRELIARWSGRPVDTWAALDALPGPFGRSNGAAPARPDPAAHLSWLVDEALATLDPELPTWIVGWPAGMTSSAGLDPADPTTTLRSELYWRGLELSDGFPFVSDGAWQRARATEENAARRAQGEEVVLDARFLDAVDRLPAGAGMAMGVDRLCMALLGASALREVMPFAWEER